MGGAGCGEGSGSDLGLAVLRTRSRSLLPGHGGRSGGRGSHGPCCQPRSAGGGTLLLPGEALSPPPAAWDVWPGAALGPLAPGNARVSRGVVLLPTICQEGHLTRGALLQGTVRLVPLCHLQGQSSFLFP
jgi:hypothetical protein